MKKLDRMKMISLAVSDPIDELKRALVGVKKICRDSAACAVCPFASKDPTHTGVVICRLSSDEWEMFTPMCWEVDDWKETEDENS